MIKINRVPIFTKEIFHFTLPNFEEWKKQIKQILLVEENEIHKINSSPEKQSNVMGKRTAWNSHERYPSLGLLCKEIKKYLEKFIEQEGYDIPSLETEDCWLNWYKKNNYAQPHKHGSAIATVLFVDVEKSNNKLFFHSDDYSVLVKKNDTSINFSDVKEITANDGTVIFFDGSINHSVSLNTTDNTRITMAANFRPVYYENRKEIYK
jgi:uncharacterized protein (TIGR02466 family)